MISSTAAKLALREFSFRLVCRHAQGDRPNILLYCNRRGGSTWMLNTMAAHPGCRYVGRPFLTLPMSRHRRRLPSLARQESRCDAGEITQITHIEEGEEEEFRRLANDIIAGRIEIYPTLNFRAPYFHRVTNRLVLQMTSGGPLIEWFDQNFDVMTGILLRHPISNALSILNRGWTPHAHEYLDAPRFVEAHLSGAQVDLARRILAGESELARHVLDWCLKLLVPIRAFESGRHPSWFAWSYEEAVRDPERMVRLLARRFAFTDVEAMVEQAMRPSRTVTRSTAEKLADESYVLARWREEVSGSEEKELLAIPSAFGLNVYRVGEDGPTSAYRHFDES